MKALTPVLIIAAFVLPAFVDSLPWWVVFATAAFLWSVVGVLNAAERRQ